MAGHAELLECPLCDFAVHLVDSYVLQLHFEQVHTTDSPFRVENDPELLPPPLPKRPTSSLSTTNMSSTTSSDEEETSVTCPELDCGELVLISEFNDHLDYHAAEKVSFDDTIGKYHSQNRANMHGPKPSAPHAGSSKPSFRDHDSNAGLPEARRRHDDSGRKSKRKPQRGRSDTSSSGKSMLSRTIQTFNPFARTDKKVKPPPGDCRLGPAELGPHAWEEHMPKWLHDQLAAGGKITLVNRIGRDGRLIKQEHVQNETPGVIPILAQLSALDRSVKEAYYCHPSTLYIGKTPKEGGFCGYRNIQMLISYIQGSRAQGHEEFPGRTPGVLKIQDLIEDAWDKGINTIGRQQTGGIRDTRKYIGTPEAQALFLSSQIDCGVQMFSDGIDGSIEAHEALLSGIERYFAQAAVSDGSNVYKTLLPPIYLQQPGHSVTIIGFERRRDGTCNLMVFDPMYNPSPAMHKLIGRKDIKTHRPEVLYAYRRGARQLKKQAAFEILMLTGHPPLFPAWDVLRQFPDLRYLYVFFRSRTLGFDVYPEDHFLRNFPWQQYGGLWIVDDARFARSESLNPLTAQALRRITGEGASVGSSQSSSLTASFSGGSSHHQLPQSAMHSLTSTAPTRQVSSMSSFDGSAVSMPGLRFGPECVSLAPVLNMLGMHTSSSHPDIMSTQSRLSILTDIGRKYPGYPSSLSPTWDAKQAYPSPASEAGSGIVTPQAPSPAVRSASPMSIDGSEMCGPSRRCLSHGYEHYAAIGLPPTSFPDNDVSSHLARNGMKLVPEAKFGGSRPPYLSQCSSPRSPPSIASLSPTSPPRTESPRAAMAKTIVLQQAFHALSHQPTPYNQQQQQQLPTPPSTLSPTSPFFPTSPPSISIANGLETSTASPLSPSGELLSYTSNRSVDNGLLAVKPLSESQVAEYRFWRPCGRRDCAFGCRVGWEGEVRAARRLFRSVEEVRDEEEGESESGEGEYKEGEEREWVDEGRCSSIAEF